MPEEIDVEEQGAVVEEIKEHALVEPEGDDAIVEEIKGHAALIEEPEEDEAIVGEIKDCQTKLVNFKIDKDLWRRLKARCALKQRSMKSVLDQLVREYLDRNLEV